MDFKETVGQAVKENVYFALIGRVHSVLDSITAETAYLHKNSPVKAETPRDAGLTPLQRELEVLLEHAQVVLEKLR